MPSMYTDEERMRRYDKLRRQKKALETYLDIAMWAMLLFSALAVIPNAFNGFLFGVFVGQLGPFFWFLYVTAAHAAAIWAVYSKDYRFTACVLAGIPLTAPFLALLFKVGQGLIDFAPEIVILAITLVVDLAWHPLTQQEGFPLFDISYEEREQQKRLTEKRVINRTLEAGVRIASTEQTGHMSDLLDDDRETMVIAPSLHNYHDRVRELAAPGAAQQSQQAAGEMAVLEEIAMPASAVQQQKPAAPDPALLAELTDIEQAVSASAESQEADDEILRALQDLNNTPPANGT